MLPFLCPVTSSNRVRTLSATEHDLMNKPCGFPPFRLPGFMLEPNLASGLPDGGLILPNDLSEMLDAQHVAGAR